MTVHPTIEEAQSTIRATVARALAEALVLGIDECAESEHPLTQYQKVDLATMAVMSYDNAIEASENLAVFAKTLAKLKGEK